MLNTKKPKLKVLAFLFIQLWFYNFGLEDNTEISKTKFEFGGIFGERVLML